MALPDGARRRESGPPAPPGAAAPSRRRTCSTFIGNADRAEAAAYYCGGLGDRPVEVWAVNYPGFGGSTGPARLKAIAPAALAAYDALAKHANGKPIFVSGRSLGTTAALHVAANRPVAGCVLCSPPPLRNLILGHYGWWNLWLIAGPVALSVPSDLDSLRNAPKVHRPGRLRRDGQRRLVPSKYQRKVSGAYAGEKRIVRLPKSGHNAVLDENENRQYEQALDWLWRRGSKSSVERSRSPGRAPFRGPSAVHRAKNPASQRGNGFAWVGGRKRRPLSPRPPGLQAFNPGPLHGL